MNTRHRIRSLSAACLLVLGTAAAATARANEPRETATPATPWTLNRFRNEFCGEDNWEPFNRSMFWVTDATMTYVADPFCRLYCSILPKPLIKGIANAVANSEYPERLFADLFRAEWCAAWDETRRFFVNTTLGIGGLFDPAKNWFRIFSTDASFAGTFATWGIPPGPKLAIPYTPCVNLRDNIGYGVDICLDPKNYLNIKFSTDVFISWSASLWPNYAPVWNDVWRDVLGGLDDRYALYMPLMCARSSLTRELWTWRYSDLLFESTVCRLKAKQLPEGSAERTALENRAAELIPDVRPPVHAAPAKPAAIRGRWCDIPGYAPRGPAIDTLRAKTFTPLADDDFWWAYRSIFNADFRSSADIRSVAVWPGMPKARYAFVPAPENAARERLAIIIPGLNGSHDSQDALAFAEMLHAAGYATLVCDSSFHVRCLRAVHGGILPGYLPADAARYAAYLANALEDLKADERIAAPEISVVGWSMGGLMSAHLAALEERRGLAFPVARYLAINPPVDLAHALAPLAASLQESAAWSRDDAHRVFTEVTGGLFGWIGQRHPRFDPANPPSNDYGEPWDYAPNITERNALFIIAEMLGSGLPELLAASHRVKPLPGVQSELTWFSRRAFYDELDAAPFRDYWDRYLPSFYANTPREKLFAATSLVALEKTLRENGKIALIHTRDDFLLTDEDRAFLDRTLADRISWFSCGGHCGMFYTKPFEREVLDRLAHR